MAGDCSFLTIGMALEGIRPPERAGKANSFAPVYRPPPDADFSEDRRGRPAGKRGRGGAEGRPREGPPGVLRREREVGAAERPEGRLSDVAAVPNAGEEKRPGRGGGGAVE